MDRTWFFVPGNNEKFLAKAKELAADVIIFDLEDSVVPDGKIEAREMILETLKNDDIKSKKYIRVNEIDSLYFINDISSLISEYIDGIITPKVNSTDDMKIVDYLISQFEKENGLKSGTIKTVPLIETGKGVVNAFEIASSNKRIESIAFGAEDYMLDVNIPKDENNALLHARSTLVTAASAAGISPPVDSVFTDFKDEEGLLEASRTSKGLGFQGRLVIHPEQIDDVNTIFAPTDEELAEAKKIVEAYESSFEEGSGIVEVNGKMIDTPVAQRAKKLLYM